MAKLLKIGKKESEPLEGQEKAPAQTTLAAMVLRAWLIGAVLLAGLAWAGYAVLTESVRDGEIERDRERLTEVGQRFEAWLDRYVFIVEAAARDPALATLLAAGEPGAVMKRQRELAQALGATRVLLIVDGMESRRLGRYPMLSYAELDMVLEARAGNRPPVEAHKAAASGGHFDVVRAVRHGDAIAGYLLVSFDTTVLEAALSRLAASYSGRIELLQQVGQREERLLAAIGEPLDHEPLIHPVRGSLWQLRYWAPRPVWQVMGVDWPVLYWTTMAELLAVMGLMMALLRRYLEGVLTRDARIFYSYVRDRIGGQWLGKSYQPRLKEFNGPLEKLKALNLTPQGSLRRVPRKRSLGGKGERSGRRKAEEKSERVADKQAESMGLDDAFADVLFQDKGALEVEEHAAEPAPAPAPAPAPEKAAPAEDGAVPRAIFRAYDIRGVVDSTLTTEGAYEIGRAIGSEAWVRGEQAVVVARDGRFSGPKLSEALIRGLRESGRDVIDIGRVPTPVLYFATHYLSSRSGVMVTGSHNPPDYNGFKIVLKGEALSGDDIRALHSRIANQDYTMGEGALTSQEIDSDYIARVIADVTVRRPLRVVVDCGNGVAGAVAPAVLRGIGCELHELYCEVDGHFPNHHPDPSRPENLFDLAEEVRRQGADLGLAFDGDGDRLGVVDSNGNIIWPDRVLMLLATHVLNHHAGAQVIYDVKCSRHLRSQIEAAGGVPLMWKSGHSMLRAKLQETGAVLAGELSGHIFFNDRWYGFDDALYSAVRLIEIIAAGNLSSAELFARLPAAVATPELFASLPEGRNFEVMEKLRQRASFGGAELITLDGIRAEFEAGWGLVRASNTTPALGFRFEADDEQTLERIKQLFRQELLAVEPSLELPF